MIVGEVRIVGMTPLICSDVKIDRKLFLTVPIENEIPVWVEMTWHPMYVAGQEFVIHRLELNFIAFSSPFYAEIS